MLFSLYFHLNRVGLWPIIAHDLVFISKTLSKEPDFSPGYLRERMRLLADPQGWSSRRRSHRSRLNWRLIVIVAALLLLSACAVAVVTGQFSQWFPRMGGGAQGPGGFGGGPDPHGHGH